MNLICFMRTGSTTDTPDKPWFATKKTEPSGDRRTSIGFPPTYKCETIFIFTVSTFTTIPEYSVDASRYRPSAVKSRWSTPGQGIDTLLISLNVVGSRKSRRLLSSATTTALVPSGVKYRLYGSVTLG